MARSCEGAALSFDPRITNSEGASLSTRSGEVALANSRGFAASYPATSISLSTEALADDEDGKKRNAWWFSAERNLRSLMDPETLGPHRRPARGRPARRAQGGDEARPRHLRADDGRPPRG